MYDADGDLDSGYIDADAQLGVAVIDTADPIGSIEMLVNGRRIRAADLYQPPCCSQTASIAFTLHPADLAAEAPGDVTVTVIARDRVAAPGDAAPGPHVSVSAFEVYIADPFDEPGDIDSETDAPDPPDWGETAASAAAAKREVEAAMPPPLQRSLLPAEADRATTLIAAWQGDPGSPLAKVLGGAQFKVAEVGTFSTGTDKNSVVGATVRLVVDEPVAFRGVVPTYTAGILSGSSTFAWVPFSASVDASAIRDVVLEIRFAPPEIVSVRFGPLSRVERYGPAAGQGPLPVLPDYQD